MPPRQLFFYDTPEDGGGEPPVDPDVQPDVQPVVEGTGDAEGAAEQAAWSVSQEDWNRTQQYLQATAPIIEQAAQLLAQQQQMQQQPVPEQQPMPEFDPWDPQAIQAYINSAIQQGIQQATGPYEQMFSVMAESEGERLARAQMERLSEEVGTFDQDATYMIAAGALADENLNPDVVLSSAARYMHDFEERIRADERTKYAAELNGMSGRPADTPVGASAGREDEQVPRGPRRYHEAVERALARRNPGMPIG